MADRIEQEIEEILAKFDNVPGEGERKPVSIAGRRRKRPHLLSGLGGSVQALVKRLSPTTLLFAGAGVMVAGLVVANWWDPAIWASFGGVVLFIAAFAWSFFRTSRPARAESPKGYFWRDRYIEYEPPARGPFDRLKRRFRRH